MQVTAKDIAQGIQLFTAKDIAQGIQLFAQNLRNIRGGDDQTIKRWLLIKYGWSFSRRKDCWEKEGKEINGYKSLEEVILDINI